MTVDATQDSFNGRLHQDTNFAELLFFCSHAHFDHMTGLKSSWNFGRIYCSAVTKVGVLALTRARIRSAVKLKGPDRG